MRLRLFINCLATGIMFGVWQGSISAGLFMFMVLGCGLSGIDYAKQESLGRTE